MRHRITHGGSLHSRHDGIHVRDVHQYRDARAILRVDKRANVRDAEWPDRGVHPFSAKMKNGEGHGADEST